MEKCRICLIKEVRLHCLVNTDLQEMYEFLSGSLLEAKDMRPLYACYMCCARLRNCLRLRTACLHSEELFSHLLGNDSWEVTPAKDINTLQIAPVLHTNMGPVIQREFKKDPSPMTDEQQYEEHVGGQGICIQFKKENDVKSENVSSEDEEIDCSIQSIKEVINSASDNSSSEYGTRESYVSKSNPSITSVDLQDVYSKTVKIVLDRMDSNSFEKTAIVTKHLTPTYLEHTSQITNLNNSGNVEMLKADICEEYKQIVHTSSETRCSLNSDLFKRIRTDTCEKRYKCDTCGKYFNLSNHIRTHTSEKPYKCGTCGMGFSLAHNLSQHIRIHTGDKSYMCDTCGKRFRCMISLSTHIRVHTGEKPYKCDTCGKYFSQRVSLTKHIRTHTGEKPYKCDTCGKNFSRRYSLMKHIRTHTGEKPYKCDTCGKSFSDKSNLSTHISIHTGVKPKYFRQKSSLLKHIRTHSGELPYNCNRCGKCFRHQCSLSKHIRKHTGEKPYKCDTCGKDFAEKWFLSSHISIHTGEKPHKCDTCGKRFRLRAFLSKHVRKHISEN